MRRGRMLLVALVALVALAAVLGGALYLVRASTGPVLETVRLASFPSQLVADERAGRMLVLSSYDPLGPIARAGIGGSVRLLDAGNGHPLQTLRMGVPLSAVVDPDTGWAYVVTSGASAGPVPVGGTYLQVIDPARGVLVRTIALVAPVPLVPAPSFQAPGGPTSPAPTATAAIPPASPQPGGSDSPARDGAHSGELNPNPAVSPVPAPASGAGGSIQLLGSNGGGFYNGTVPPVLAIDAPLRRVFVVTQTSLGQGFSSRLSVIDARTGALLRAAQLPIAATAIAADGHLGRLFIADLAGHSVQVYDARTLRRLAIVPMTGCNPVEVAVDEPVGRAYALCSGPGSSMIVSLDSRSGRRLNSVAVGANGIRLLVDEARGTLYAVSAGSFLGGRPGGTRIGILDARSGASLRAVDVGGIIPQVALDPLHGRLYVAGFGRDPRTDPGVLLLLDAASGSVRKRVRVGVGTIAVAVDARQGRLFVAGASGLAPEAGRWNALVDRLRSFFGQHAASPALSQPGIDGPGGVVTVLDAAL